MDDPIADIRSVVHRLTQGSPKQQKDAIEDYFTTDASFTVSDIEHCRHLTNQISITDLRYTASLLSDGQLRGLEMAHPSDLSMV